ncbi:MAG: HrcA family transcriptional regulator, partial [FCB group bacterium]|nr:HrcA family transcriptional regulator [FCB group bacterium]
MELSPRERIVLRSVIHNYILNANPVGSRNISKRYNLGLSPATIRNTMADLEELGLIEQPFTSAGRQPTDRGYRVYVDDLMEEKFLTSIERKLIDGSVKDSLTNVNAIME